MALQDQVALIIPTTTLQNYSRIFILNIPVPASRLFDMMEKRQSESEGGMCSIM